MCVCVRNMTWVVLQEKGMWVEALKSCREYLPAKLDEVQAEYDRECGARVTRDINSLFAQASQWEQNGEFKTAVDCLLKVYYAQRNHYNMYINYCETRLRCMHIPDVLFMEKCVSASFLFSLIFQS